MKSFIIFVIKNDRSQGSCVISAEDLDDAVRRLSGQGGPGQIRGIPFMERFSESAEWRLFVYDARTCIAITACHWAPASDEEVLDEFFAKHFVRKHSATTVRRVTHAN